MHALIDMCTYIYVDIYVVKTLTFVRMYSPQRHDVQLARCAVPCMRYVSGAVAIMLCMLDLVRLEPWKRSSGVCEKEVPQCSWQQRVGALHSCLSGIILPNSYSCIGGDTIPSYRLSAVFLKA